jgi:hypothetical protein
MTLFAPNRFSVLFRVLCLCHVVYHDSSNPSKETNLSQPIIFLHTLVTRMSKIQIALDARSFKVPIERSIECMLGGPHNFELS